MGQDKGGCLWERWGEEEVSFLSLTLQAILPLPGRCILCPGKRQNTAQRPEAPKENSTLEPRKRRGLWQSLEEPQPERESQCGSGWS